MQKGKASISGQEEKRRLLFFKSLWKPWISTSFWMCKITFFSLPFFQAAVIVWVCCSIISCFILKFCPHVSTCVLLVSQPLCIYSVGSLLSGSVFVLFRWACPRLIFALRFWDFWLVIKSLFTKIFVRNPSGVALSVLHSGRHYFATRHNRGWTIDGGSPRMRANENVLAHIKTHPVRKERRVHERRRQKSILIFAQTGLYFWVIVGREEKSSRINHRMAKTVFKNVSWCSFKLKRSPIASKKCDTRHRGCVRIAPKSHS